VAGLHLAGKELSQLDLEWLASFQTVAAIQLVSPSLIPDDGIAEFKKLPHLKRLEIIGKINRTAITAMTGFGQLDDLDLSRTNIAPNGLPIQISEHLMIARIFVGYKISINHWRSLAPTVSLASRSLTSPSRTTRPRKHS